jgi:hypothetical protein
MLVNAPLSADTENEVRKKSEDIDARVMGDVLKAVVARMKKIDRDHDIPYIAGYSQNGEKIYIDRHMPKSAILAGKRVQTDRFLIVHEAVEKALLDELGLHYLHAHQIALRTERAAVEAEGFAWRDYNAFTKKHERAIDDEKLKKVPDDLDLTPYRNERDFQKLQQMMAAIKPEE